MLSILAVIFSKAYLIDWRLNQLTKSLCDWPHLFLLLTLITNKNWGLKTRSHYGGNKVASPTLKYLNRHWQAGRRANKMLVVRANRKAHLRRNLIHQITSRALGRSENSGVRASSNAVVIICPPPIAQWSSLVLERHFWILINLLYSGIFGLKARHFYN